MELGPLVDHHCHGVVTTDLDRAGFEELMNESPGPSPLGTTVFDSMLGLAIRRWCAPVLDLEPHASPEAYLARRAALGIGEVNRRLVGLLRRAAATYLLPNPIRVRQSSPHKCLKNWRTRHDSNVRPSPSEGDALSS